VPGQNETSAAYICSHVCGRDAGALSKAMARLSELASRVRQQHERITLTRNGEPEAVLLSVDAVRERELPLRHTA
jgi:prevent-host-death family protein